jgi:hypothetical protein
MAMANLYLPLMAEFDALGGAVGMNALQKRGLTRYNRGRLIASSSRCCLISFVTKIRR